MTTRRRSVEGERRHASGAALTPVRGAVLLGLLVSLSLTAGRRDWIHAAGVLSAVALYAVTVVGLSHRAARCATSGIRERLMLGADLLFCAAVLLFSGGIRSPYFGLLYLALINAALLLGPRRGLCLAATAVTVIVVGETVMPGGQARRFDLSFALGKLPFLPLIVWGAGRLAQEMRDREAALRESERRALILEAQDERVRQEMEAARRVQESLLPTATHPPTGLAVATLFQPAREVGGDIYDLVELPDGRLLVAIADVCGKGLPAALLAVAVQQRIRQFAGADPAAILAGINRLLLEKSPDEMFVTAACVVIDPRAGDAAVAVAGHPPPLRWEHAGERLVPVRARGPSLGLMPVWAGSTERCRLAPGDVLILYTDGVVDAKVGPKERLGEQRLAALLGRTRPESPQEWVERVQGVLDGCAQCPDDVTVIAIGREPWRVAAPRPVARAAA